MGAPKNKTYKRSWKNLLLNKQYQLSFTLLMVGLSALLMAALGYWVNREAAKATQISLNNLKDCRVAPAAVTPEPARTRQGGAVEVDLGEMKTVQPGGEEGLLGGGDGADGAEGTEGAEGDGEARGAPDGNVEPEAGSDADEPVDDQEPVADPPLAPAPMVSAPALDRSQWRVDPKCKEVQDQKRQELLDGQRLILYVLIGVGLMLIVGLAVFGIKMTHKVAGPLHKVSLYLAKMKDGKFDEVYNLRKGDQLVDFYEHFKGAHAGVKQMQVEDIERLTEIIEAAEEHDLASKSPELAAAIDELRAIVKRKEEGLV